MVVIIECKGEILLTRRNQDPGFGLLDLPGGFVDPGESFEQALNREIEEELGISLNNPTYLSSFANSYLYGGITYRTSDAIFVEQVSQRPDMSIAKDEISGIIWKPLKQIHEKDMAFRSCWQALALFLEQQKSQS